MRADFGDRGDFRGRARDEAFREGRQFVRHDGPFDHFDLALLGQLDRGLAGQPVEETIRRRRVQRAVAHKEDVRAGRLGHLAAIVEHQRISIAVPFGGMLGHGADHVKAGRLGMAGRCVGCRTAPFGVRHPDAFHLVLEIIAPVPDGDRQMDRVLLGRHAHHFRPAPGDGPDIGRLEAGLRQSLALGFFHLFHAERNFVAKDLGRPVQAIGMIQRAEDLAIIGTLALEYRAAVMEGVCQDVYLGIPPRHELAVHPDVAIAIVICGSGHRISALLACTSWNFAFISPDGP